MTWRWLAVGGLGLPLVVAVASLPSLGAEALKSELRLNRQRITLVLNAPGGQAPLPLAREERLNRQRITTLADDLVVPGAAILVPPPLTTPEPPLAGPPTPAPAPPAAQPVPPVLPVPPLAAPAGKPAVAPGVQPVAAPPVAAPPVPLVPGASIQPATMCVVKWVYCRGPIDDHGRRWHLIQGRPLHAQPTRLTGWLLRSPQTAPLFFSSEGNLYRLVF